MKVIITENKRERAVLKYLSAKYGDLTPIEYEVLPIYIFFEKEGEVVFKYNKENGIVKIIDEHLWSFLETVFGLRYFEIENAIKEWIIEDYKLFVVTIQH